MNMQNIDYSISKKTNLKHNALENKAEIYNF